MLLAMPPLHVVPLWRLVSLLGVVFVLESFCRLYWRVVFSSVRRDEWMQICNAEVDLMSTLC